MVANASKRLRMTGPRVQQRKCAFKLSHFIRQFGAHTLTIPRDPLSTRDNVPLWQSSFIYLWVRFFFVFFFLHLKRLIFFVVIPFIRIFCVQGMLATDSVKCARNFLLSLNYGRFGVFGFCLVKTTLSHIVGVRCGARISSTVLSAINCVPFCVYMCACTICSFRVNIAKRKTQNAFQPNRALKNTHNMHNSSQFICNIKNAIFYWILLQSVQLNAERNYFKIRHSKWATTVLTS